MWIFYAVIAFMTAIAVFFICFPLFKKDIRQKRSFKLCLFLLVLVPVVAILLYHHWGSSSKLQAYWARERMANEVQAQMATIKSPEQVVAQLKAHLKSHPDSAKGWYLLGRLYLSQHQNNEAVSALKKAVTLQPGKPLYRMTCIEAQFMKRGHLILGEVNELKALLKQRPNAVDVMNLLAMNAYFQKNYKTAIVYWERMLPYFNSTSPDEQELLKMIHRAQIRLGQ